MLPLNSQLTLVHRHFPQKLCRRKSFEEYVWIHTQPTEARAFPPVLLTEQKCRCADMGTYCSSYEREYGRLPKYSLSVLRLKRIISSMHRPLACPSYATPSRYGISTSLRISAPVERHPMVLVVVRQLVRRVTEHQDMPRQDACQFISVGHLTPTKLVAQHLPGPPHPRHSLPAHGVIKHLRNILRRRHSSQPV